MPPTPLTEAPDLLAGLNNAQRRAVVHDAGPLIVLAGPGTGKTRVIIHRIAWAIAERGVAPDRVLAVTFTRKATEELRTRLVELLGDAKAAPVNVHSFNGFGWRIATRFADYLGLPAVTTLIDAVQARRLLRHLVVEHGLFTHARAEGLGVLTGRLVEAFKKLAHIGKLPEDCAAHAKAWRTRFDAGDRTDDPAAELHRLRMWEDEARIYAIYSAERHRRGWLTYDDQLLLPIRLLREHPGPASIIRGELAHVVVDEFQDCNLAQIELLCLLIGPGTRQSIPDVTIVGDDDQAIYAFRGADERAFERFSKAWPGATTIELTENYRSGTGIITACNTVITRAGHRFHADKTLEQAKTSTAGSGTVEAIGLPHEAEDAATIATLLRLDGAGTPAKPWDHYAVIGRGNADLARIAGVLRLEGIPFDISTDDTLLDDDVVDDALAWAAWVAGDSAASAIRRVITRPPIGIDGQRALELEMQWRAATGKGVVAETFSAWLRREGDVRFTSACDRRDALALATSGLRGDQALAEIITSLDLAHADLAGGHRRARRVLALVALMSLARDKQPRLEPPGDLATLLRYVDELHAADAFEAPGNLGENDDGRVEAEGDDALGRVFLVTAHRSKGLEFPTVLVPRVGGHGYGSAREKDEWESPPGLFDLLEDRDPKSRLRDESRRVFYVACTRAQQRLVILGRWNKSASKTTNLFEELARPVPPGVPITVVQSADIANQATRAGLRVPVAAGAATTREPAIAFAQRARAAARLDAAAALEAVERADADDLARSAARAALAAASDRLAALAEAARTGIVPAWHQPPHPDVAALAERVTSDQAGTPAARLLRPMPAPLRLSYSMLDQYRRCGRCFYLRHVMGLGEEQTDEASVGNIVHTILQHHFQRTRLAVAEGHAPPDAAALLRAARDGYMDSLGASQAPDRGDLEEIQALVSAVHTLHDPAANILELEHNIRFPYELDGVMHQFTAKIDRIEQCPDGTYRVIDYKTSKPWKGLVEPEADDLQFGIYAMALRHLYGTDIAGGLEYWLLASSQRGRIDFAAIDFNAVKETIDDSIRGMLSGVFPRGKTKEGPCDKDCAFLPDE